MGTSHQRATRRSRKSSDEYKAQGRPSKIKSVHLTLSSLADKNTMGAHAPHDEGESSKGNLNDEDSAGVEGTKSEEDELYGKEVSDNDGLDDAAVAQKPCQNPKNATAGEKPP